MTRAEPVDCVAENSRMVPLIKVVKAAIIDTYGDINSMQQMYLHWAGRGTKKMQREVLRMGGKKVLITINENTKTATLPLDFDSETFVGVIDSRGQKVPLKLNSNLADNCSYEEIDYENKCTSCGQDKSICEELSVTETDTIVIINNSSYIDKVVKKLYPNGDYYLETTKHVLSLADDTVSPFVTKEFITNLGLKPCGCLETTTDNIANLRNHCYETYCCHYAPCDCNCVEGGYAIFEETGLIQFDYSFPYTKVYLEYVGFLPKKNGQYVVPEVAFETLVEYVKFKSVCNKKNVPLSERMWYERSYLRERGNMMKINGRVFLSSIVNASRKVPRFNIDFGETWYGCFSSNTITTTSSSYASSTTTTSSSTTIINNTGFQLAVLTGRGIGHPVDGQSTYQNNLLKGSTDTEFVFLAKQTLSKIKQDFTLDTITGIIDISPLTFIDGDDLIIPYNKIS